MNRLLDGVRVVESGGSPAVRYCGRQFALSGANVTRIDPDQRRDGQKSAVDDYLDHPKTFLRREVRSDDVAGADVVIASPEFDWSMLATYQVQAISGTVDPFSPGGERQEWSAPEIVLASAGGAAGYTRSDKDVPVYGFGRRFQYLAGEYLFIALTSLLGSQDDDVKSVPRVRVCAAEVVAGLLPYGTTQYAYNGTTTTVEQSGPRFVVECTDGFLCVYAGGSWRDLAALLDGAVEFNDNRFIDFAQRFAHVEELNSAVQKWAEQRSLDEAIARADACSVAVAPCFDLDMVLADTSLFDSGLLSTVEIGGHEATVPGLPYRVRGDLR